MKNRKLSPESSRQHSKIPELDVIDLEKENNDSPDAAEPGNSNPADEPTKRGILSRINIHIVLLAVVLLFVAGIIYKVMNFGVRVNLDEIFADGPGEYNDSYDMILPLLDQSQNPIYKDYKGSTILAFGNAPFADDRGSEDNLVSLMEQESGATIYNCSIAGSFMATDRRDRNVEISPWDIFNAYWLCNIAVGNEDVRGDYLRALELLGDEAPAEAMEVYDILTSIDLNQVDAIVVMYDAGDYLAGRDMYDPNNSTNIATFAGNTEAIIEYMNYYAPHVRIIVMSPPYAFGVDENGEYVSSDIKRYGNQDVLSVYAILQYTSCVTRSTTFVDNIYTTFNEDNAKRYLKDNVHLNQKGRERVAERFVYALNYYSRAGQNSDPTQSD